VFRIKFPTTLQLLSQKSRWAVASLPEKGGAGGKSVPPPLRIILDGQNIVRIFVVRTILPKNAKCGAKKLPC